MKWAKIPFRLLFLAVIMMLTLAGLVARLWYVQIARGAEYTAKCGSSSRVTVRIPAVRGEILDRNGIPLVQNRASFDVDFYLPDMVNAYRKEHGSTPKHIYRGVIHNMQADVSEADVRKIVADEIIPRLEELGVAQDYNADRIQIHYRLRGEVPYNYLQDLDFDTMALLSERNLGLPGVNITKKPVRQYLYGSLGAHFLGYVGMPNDLDKLPDIKDYNFYDPDMEGKAQIELAMNDYLKGTPGVKILQRDAKGKIMPNETEIKEPKQGDNVYLTIDARIQYIAEEAIRSIGRGAVVIVDPNNGDILAMVSVPSYDPNKFIPSIAAKDWMELNKDDTDPLLNRALSAYAPGSTFKINTGLAGLRAGIGNRTFNCSGGVTYGNKYMKCWIAAKGGAHGTINLPDALKYSCNAFFYQYGNAAGIDQIDFMGQKLGLGQKSGIPLSGEAPGVLPGKEWLKQVRPNDRWSDGFTANTAIGQGDVLATPLQMAIVAATVANGGTCYFPRLVDKVVAQDGRVVLQEPSRVRSNLITDAGLKPEQIEKIRLGMRKVVNDEGGTAGKARVKDVIVAGKTGTAQFWRNGKQDNHTWFVSFAPYDSPKYAICVMVQGAKAGGMVPAPIAAHIYDQLFAMEKDPSKAPQLAWLEPAKGNFNFVEGVDFGREVPAATNMAADEETGGDADPSRNNKQENKPDAPNVREEADAGGRVKNNPPPERKSSGLEKFFNFFKGGKKDKPTKAAPSPAPGRR
ncbi:penicillin-binding protein 2 [soil metagenome]